MFLFHLDNALTIRYQSESLDVVQATPPSNTPVGYQPIISSDSKLLDRQRQETKPIQQVTRSGPTNHCQGREF